MSIAPASPAAARSGGKGICGRWNGVCTCTTRVLEYTCYYSTISPTTYALTLAAYDHQEQERERNQMKAKQSSATVETLPQHRPSSSRTLLALAPEHTNRATTSSAQVHTNIDNPLSPGASQHQINSIRALHTTPTMRFYGSSSSTPRCTRFKHSISLRELDYDTYSGSTANPGGWFLQRLIEVATTGNLVPTVPSGAMVGSSKRAEELQEEVREKVMEVDAQCDGLESESRQEETGVERGMEKSENAIAREAEGAVLEISRTLEALKVSSIVPHSKIQSSPTPAITTIIPTTTRSTPLSPLSSSSHSSPTPASITTTISTLSPPTTPPPLSPSTTATPTTSPSQPNHHSPPSPTTLLTHTAQCCRPYYPSSPVLSARKYVPSESSPASYPAYKSIPGSMRDSGVIKGSSACILRGIRRDHRGVVGSSVGHGTERERVYSGSYTWSGYSSAHDCKPESSNLTQATARLNPIHMHSARHTSRIGKRGMPRVGGGSSVLLAASSSRDGAVVGLRRMGRRGPYGNSSMLGMGKSSGMSGVRDGNMDMDVDVDIDVDVDVDLDVDVDVDVDDVRMIMEADFDYDDI